MQTKLQRLYDAKSLGEGISVLQDAVPSWAPMTALVGGGVLYVCSYRIRLLLSKWRRHERTRLIQKYQRLESAANSPSPYRDDDSCVVPVDPTVVTEEDLDEFHMSLGLMAPRDADLIKMVDEMLLTAPIPKGWFLYRCSTGFLRFRECNTEELRFFHPSAKHIESVVRTAVAARNQADMDFQFGALSRGASTSGSGGDAPHADRPLNEPEINFSEGDGVAAAESKNNDDELFGRVFAFFLKRETEKMEAEVEESFRPIRRGKRSSSRRNGGQLTPSLRVTTVVPTLDLTKIADSPTKEDASHAGGIDSLPPVPPRRPPTPRSASGVFDRTSSTVGQAPRVPSFRGPQKTAPNTPTSARASMAPLPLPAKPSE